ncbi:hypothetical protein FAM09_07740 [Niastella caeni]|uniref:Uncharacterized protein n=1 Tax=Niastella caeni TaxID=2569763 RepID=A0A4S8I1Y7_9BACT|nr:hypothetical protein [Niastella caeni]THU41985.1 hypothetical protein FAM09_07740 [Niastella caeni]
MRARRLRRRLFNLFAFTILAFAIYLVAFSKDEPMPQADQTAHAVSAKTAPGNASSYSKK